jgi:uncharacterized OsmC-like protein/ketosteroid isomerase-like protein
MVPEDIQTVTLSHVGNYQFLIDFGMIAPLQSDEPHPIGQGQGPSPEQLLAASIANCLCASLFFALTKYRQPADGLKADVAISTLRNERGRLRIRAVNVDIVLPMESQKEEQISRALSQFEDFCTVSESVKRGIPVNVSISDGAGTLLSVPVETFARAPAASPEDLVRLFADRANAGDVEGLVDLYEPQATLAAGERLSHGRADIQQFYASLLERKKEFSGADVVQKLEGDDLAVTIAQAPGGGLSLEVARRQPDGTWRWVIDQLKLKLPV